MTDLSWCRDEFPALKMTVNGHPAAFFDGPGGTQVPKRVIDAVVDYYETSNANTHGEFATSRRTDEVIAEARRAAADFLGCSPDEVAFGANMTTLNFALARALGRELGPEDEVVITDLDHEANRAPWVALREKGVIVKSVAVRVPECVLDYEDFERKVTDRTRVVAVGYASNAVGTINDVRKAVHMARAVGAVCVIDAVHYALHGAIDVEELGCDFLLCSAYKFFGPHVGIMYGRRSAFERLGTYKVRPQLDEPPYKIETGTLNHEGLAGVVEAVNFIGSLGRATNEPSTSRRRDVLKGFEAIERHERPLFQQLMDGLRSMRGITVYGLPAEAERTPTVSFTVSGRSPAEVARYLGDRGIFVWDGDFYATTLIERLGLADRGGVVRVGIAPYNTKEEVQRLLDALRELSVG